jgi:hypothetical protein
MFESLIQCDISFQLVLLGYDAFAFVWLHIGVVRNESAVALKKIQVGIYIDKELQKPQYCCYKEYHPTRLL